ncbi:uncharacterized protein K444DRAFT_664073 [Hyaloscypha bicolor E]|uniref:Uncharacterized protein n=1 Tax=Hyaloscypha bicolor E TaxID=1095630 RepID=A0A2J6T761_9HELO|nr:uncharacterized protein K444DRAFT_664073 [Hyaloscypha bicolor E]PMD58856.1 hypothetical protein K444DRAFT_664073 [Hyaloscypha bicolor E]
MHQSPTPHAAAAAAPPAHTLLHIQISGWWKDGRSTFDGPRAESTPPSSLHPDNPSPTSPPGYTAPDTPPNMGAGNQPVYNYTLSNLQAIAIFSPQLTFKIQRQNHKNKKTKKPQYFKVPYPHLHSLRLQPTETKSLTKPQFFLLLIPLQGEQSSLE